MNKIARFIKKYELMFKMYNLSQIQKKIIHELGKNSRQSYKKISKSIKSKKEVVAYNTTQLLEKGVIAKFVPVFDLSKLSIISGKIYLRLAGLKKEQEQKVIDSLAKDKEISWLAKAVGRWDLLIGIYSQNINYFSKKKDEILSKLSKYIQDYDVSFIEAGLVYNRDYLIESQPQNRKEFIFEQGKTEKTNLTNIEKRIIGLIKNNARVEVIEISRKLNLDARTITKYIKNLWKKGVLQGYTVFLNLKSIGFKLNKLCIYLEKYDKEKIFEILSYLKLNSNTIHVIKSLGKWEFEIETENNNIDEVYNYISELKAQFPDAIKQIDLVTIVDEMKLEFFPEEI